MIEKPKVFQFTIIPSVVERVKAAGYGKFPIGLYNLLAELDRLKGTIDKLESPKGGTKHASIDYEDPASLENTNAKKARMHREHLNSPEALTEIIGNEMEVYFGMLYPGLEEGDLSRFRVLTNPDRPRDAAPLHDRYDPEVHGPWTKYLTPERRERALVRWREALRTAMIRINNDLFDRQYGGSSKPVQHEPTAHSTLKLSEAALVYTSKTETPADMPDEVIEDYNKQCAEGGEYYKHKPIKHIEPDAEGWV
jgi:hypothetical protein